MAIFIRCLLALIIIAHAAAISCPDGLECTGGLVCCVIDGTEDYACCAPSTTTPSTPEISTDSNTLIAFGLGPNFSLSN